MVYLKINTLFIHFFNISLFCFFESSFKIECKFLEKSFSKSAIRYCIYSTDLIEGIWFIFMDAILVLGKGNSENRRYRTELWRKS